MPVRQTMANRLLQRLGVRLRGCGFVHRLPIVAFVACLGWSLLASPVAAGAATAAETTAEWRLDRNREGIEIYTRAVEGSRYRAVRAVMVVDFSLPQLVALIRDTDACPEWADLCKRSEIIETLSETELYVYTHNNLPWPVSDRDAVAHVLWTVSEEDKIVTMTATATTGRVEPKRGITRLEEAVTRWILKPLASGQVEVTSEAHVNPGGPMPAWIINRLLLDAPFKTLRGMRRVLATGRYSDAEFDFLP